MENINSIENKKYALEQAIFISKDKPEDIVKYAKEFEQFLVAPAACDETEKTNGKRSYTTFRSTLENRIIGELGELTKSQKVVLGKAIELHCAGKKVSGSAVARALTPPMTQSNASIHMRSLVKEGYMLRPEVQRFVPIFNQGGNPVPVNVKEVPAAYAKSYKGLQHDLSQNPTLKKFSQNGSAAAA